MKSVFFRFLESLSRLFYSLYQETFGNKSRLFREYPDVVDNFFERELDYDPVGSIFCRGGKIKVVGHSKESGTISIELSFSCSTRLVDYYEKSPIHNIRFGPYINDSIGCEIEPEQEIVQKTKNTKLFSGNIDHASFKPEHSNSVKLSCFPSHGTCEYQVSAISFFSIKASDQEGL